jgi:hypothetical protein
LGSRLERDYQTITFRVRVYVDVDRWVIKVLSDAVDMVFKATCYDPKACPFIHQAFLSYASVVAEMVGDPGFIEEARELVESIYKNWDPTAVGPKPPPTR